jgi:hypothetical protein
MIPVLLKRYMQVQVGILIPSARPLFLLLGFLLFVYALIAVSLMPIRRPRFLRNNEGLSVKGRGDPQAFFALVEEGCRLLSAAGTPHRSPVRLEQEGDPQKKATLVETSAEPLQSVARPAGYLCLPFVLVLLSMGFTRLIHFRKPLTEMPWTEFLTHHLPGYFVEVAFALGLIIIALQLAERARRLFGIRRYRSAVIFLHVLPEPTSSDALEPGLDETVQSAGPDAIRWQLANGADDAFAGWVRAPHAPRRFRIEALWAEAYSESARADEPRFLVDLRQSQHLDAAIQHIIKIPFYVAFEPDGPTRGSDACPPVATNDQNTV